MKKIKKPYSDEVIMSAVSDVFCISQRDIFKKTRRKETVEARQVAIYYFRLANKMSFPSIGEIFGGMDHTTAIYAFRKVVSKMEQDSKFYALVQKVFDKIENPNIKLDETLTNQQEKKREAEKEVSAVKEKPRRIVIQNFIISDREKEIMAKYRQGMTLQQIAYDFGITRERIRQIVFKVNLKEIGAKTKEGFEIDMEEYIRAEKLAHNHARSVENEPEINEAINEESKRWSRFYIKCRGCGTIKIPHSKKGYCKKCIGETRRSVLTNDSICASCGMERAEAMRKFGRDLYVTKTGKILCRGCFMQFTGSKLSESRRQPIG